MNKPAYETKDRTGPSVLRFKGCLIRDPQAPRRRSSALIKLPTHIGKKLRGMTKVEGTINGHPFRASLESSSVGSSSLRVNNAMRNGAGGHAGEIVSLSILGPELTPRVPTDLRIALTASRDAKKLWNDLTTMGRRDWIRWIESAKTHETRARRVKRTVDQLSEGKRRPCCVNVYEFMMRRVRE